jgi:uncharacterized protein
MEFSQYIIVGFAVCLAAGLTFFSGFGLGTIMLPVFSLFFPLPVAVAATAIVHLANNLFKFVLVYKNIHFPTLLRFGLPAMLSAIVGGWLLTYISAAEPLKVYVLYSKTFEISWLKLTIGFLMIFFAWFELLPKYSSYTFDKKYLPYGGILSGFFGGVSGHQGAFRAAFLTKTGLTKEQFIGTSNSIAVIIDISRLIVYALGLRAIVGSTQTEILTTLKSEQSLLIVAILFAFLGTYFGKMLVQKTTIVGVQRVVGVLLLLMGVAFIFGLL